MGLSRESLRVLWKNGAEKSGRLIAFAAEKTRAGNLKEAEEHLLNALALNFNPNTAEAFKALCSLLADEGVRKEQALKACQSAAYASYFSSEDGPSISASEASFQSYKLLMALGRTNEARDVLFRTVGNAPVSWPGLIESRAALEKFGLYP